VDWQERLDILRQVKLDQARRKRQMGGTLVNINVLDRETLLAAAENPDAYPDLLVRVTGFSAYFSRLSDELRRYVVERFVAAE